MHSPAQAHTAQHLSLAWRAWSRSIAPLLLPGTPNNSCSGNNNCTTSDDRTAHNDGNDSVSAKLSQDMYDRYVALRYAEPQRAYHTLAHVSHMLSELDGFVAAKDNAKGGNSIINSTSRIIRNSSSSSGDGGTSAAIDLALFISATTQPLQHRLLSLSPLYGHTTTTTTIAGATGTTPLTPPPTQAEVLLLVMDLAILFHDAVYDPERKDNEAASVRLLMQFLHETHALSAGQGGGGGSSNDAININSRGSNGSLTVSAGISFPPLPVDRAHGRSTTDCTSTVAAPMWHDPALVEAVAHEVAALIMATMNHFSVPPMTRMTLSAAEVAAADGHSNEDDDYGQDADAAAATATTAAAGSNANDYDDGSAGNPYPTLQLLLDLDLSILGSAPAAYAVYADRIRAEYRCFNDRDFYQGRGQFLESAMARRQGSGGESHSDSNGPSSSASTADDDSLQLFKTPFFHRRFEAAAWRNIRAELALVRGTSRRIALEDAARGPE